MGQTDTSGRSANHARTRTICTQPPADTQRAATNKHYAGTRKRVEPECRGATSAEELTAMPSLCAPHLCQTAQSNASPGTVNNAHPPSPTIDALYAGFRVLTPSRPTEPRRHLCRHLRARAGAHKWSTEILRRVWSEKLVVKCVAVCLFAELQAPLRVRITRDDFSTSDFAPARRCLTTWM